MASLDPAWVSSDDTRGTPPSPPSQASQRGPAVMVRAMGLAGRSGRPAGCKAKQSHQRVPMPRGVYTIESYPRVERVQIRWRQAYTPFTAGIASARQAATPHRARDRLDLASVLPAASYAISTPVGGAARRPASPRMSGKHSRPADWAHRRPRVPPRAVNPARAGSFWRIAWRSASSRVVVAVTVRAVHVRGKLQRNGQRNVSSAIAGNRSALSRRAGYHDHTPGLNGAAVVKLCPARPPRCNGPGPPAACTPRQVGAEQRRGARDLVFVRRGVHVEPRTARRTRDCPRWS